MSDFAVEIAVFGRAPIAGETKTRLIPALGAQGAAALHGWMLVQALANARASRVGTLTLWHTGAFAQSPLALPADLRLRAQPEGDLGQRMAAAIAASPPGVATLVVGSDCPALAPEHLRQAATALSEYEVVLIPAHDGGYVLIGMQCLYPEVFENIAWGSDQVFAQTVARLTSLNLRWLALPALWDVDQPGDLERLWREFPAACAVAHAGML